MGTTKSFYNATESHNPEGNMSEEVENQNDGIEPEVQKEEQAAELDYKSLYEQTKSDLDAIVAKKDELLGETKKAKAARQEVLQKMQQLEAQKSETMQKNGEFETLWKAEKERAHSLESQLNDFKSNIRQEKINNTAMQIASKLSKGHVENAELLKVFVGQSLNEYADDLGSISEDVVGSIEQQFQRDKKYAPLLGGSKATGGGAVGGKPGNPKTSEMSRREFDQLNAEDKAAFFKNGGRTYDE